LWVILIIMVELFVSILKFIDQLSDDSLSIVCLLER
jgi:hypothetical protein